MHPLRSTPSGLLDDPILLQNPDLRHVLDVLNPQGEETRLVGGAVRNALLGLPPGDIDLATTMEPAEVVRRAKAAKLRAIPTGIAHGTITLLSHGLPFEVTTLREDIETDGRHAVVKFGRDFALDAQRRDFTVNALSLGPDGRIFDTVGGMRDLAEGRIRFIGEAATRIREDVLRILRFFRFHATYGTGELDPVGLTAATALREGLTRLSRERVRTEILKILAAPGAMAVLHSMQTSGILGLAVPGPIDLVRLGRLVASGTETTDATLRLAALAGADPARIGTLRDALRLSNAETKRLEAAFRALLDIGTTAMTDAPDDAALLRLLFDHGRQASLDGLRLHYAAEPTTGDLRRPLSFVTEAEIPVLPFGGEDLARLGLKGPALGAALTQLRRLWAEAGFPTDRETCDALRDRAVARASGQASP